MDRIVLQKVHADYYVDENNDYRDAKDGEEIYIGYGYLLTESQAAKIVEALKYGRYVSELDGRVHFHQIDAALQIFLGDGEGEK